MGWGNDMTAKELLLDNINSQFSQEGGFASLNEVIIKEPELVIIEIVDMLCEVYEKCNADYLKSISRR
jgi:hypothetical protein